MDCVPRLFIDCVISLIDELNEFQFLSNPLWRSIATTYKDKRQYFLLCLKPRPDQKYYYSLGLWSDADENLISYHSIEEVFRLDRRYARVYGVKLVDDTPGRPPFVCSHDEYKQLVKLFITQFTHEGVEYTEICYPTCDLLQEVHQKLYFSVIKLEFLSELSARFLSDQIQNNSHIHTIELKGDWPEDIKDPMENFMLRRVHRVLELGNSNFSFTLELIERVLNDWKSHSPPVDFYVVFRPSFHVLDLQRAMEVKVSDTTFMTRHGSAPDRHMNATYVGGLLCIF
ncbi:hypothetical protein QR680_014928 [Steinernema hermaphroditum]|uniref:Uncharacterized protein n=1 Tax=Steinernema hermaphroditum TaxID=289476 RepID=A0AA39M4P7_9BILA|nr:hypothetical protein QR680_014928 [Steinernema hermaphroditum]